VDGIGLLTEARAAGLKVWTAEGRLLVRGPSRLAPVAAKLLMAKPAVVVALWTEQVAIRPIKSCYACAGRSFWRHVSGGPYVCTRCHPAQRPDVVAEQLVLRSSISPELARLLEPFEVEPCD
jgi:hypothetical protein